MTVPKWGNDGIGWGNDSSCIIIPVVFFLYYQYTGPNYFSKFMRIFCCLFNASMGRSRYTERKREGLARGKNGKRFYRKYEKIC